MFTVEQAKHSAEYRRILRWRAITHAIVCAAFMSAFGTIGFIWYAIGSDLFIQ